MRHSLTLTLAAALLALGGAAFGQVFTVNITVDENGNGTFSNSNGFFSTLPASFVQDPGPGGLNNVLTYGLLNPPGLTSGDVLMQDGVNGPIFDIVRFNSDENGGSLVFYSDNTDGFDSLGDTSGPPGGAYTNTITISELGSEGSNGAFYTPIAGQPGFVTGAGGPVTYHFISDSAVPEPATTATFGFGVIAMAGLVFFARKRKTLPSMA